MSALLVALLQAALAVSPKRPRMSCNALCTSLGLFIRAKW